MYHTGSQHQVLDQVLILHIVVCVYETCFLLVFCRYGSIPNYLESAGFTLEEQQKLKDIFLEPEDSDTED